MLLRHLYNIQLIHIINYIINNYIYKFIYIDINLLIYDTYEFILEFKDRLIVYYKNTNVSVYTSIIEYIQC